jgi:FAD/FMN-containing dehydrogenase
MSYAVKTLTKMKVPFAIKGGGHMPIPGYANINSSGVLLSSSGLNQLEISEDHAAVNIGPGNDWNDVYTYLEPFGVTVVGGRLGIVGVPGYLIGGGVSFFGNEYGWASANIASFTVSTPSGL